jgi:hypothetical protein
VTGVVGGKAAYVSATGSSPLVATQLVFSGAGTSRQLNYYRVNEGYVCPWYSSFAAALAANPFPLPFNGIDWPAQSCVAS